MLTLLYQEIKNKRHECKLLNKFLDYLAMYCYSIIKKYSNYYAAVNHMTSACWVINSFFILNIAKEQQLLPSNFSFNYCVFTWLLLKFSPFTFFYLYIFCHIYRCIYFIVYSLDISHSKQLQKYNKSRYHLLPSLQYK